MMKKTFNRQRRTQLAIVLSLLFSAPIGAQYCWGQAAGFAQSRNEAPASAESGTRRSLLPQISFFNTRTDDKESGQSALVVDSTTISQPVATNMPPKTLVAPRVQTSAPAVASSPQSSVSRAPGRSEIVESPTRARRGVAGLAAPMNNGLVSSRTSSSGGVASLLLDELEDEEPEKTVAKSSDAKEKKSARRSLRGDAFPSSLTLLKEESEGGESTSSENFSSRDVISTEDENEALTNRDDRQKLSSQVKKTAPADIDSGRVAVVVDANADDSPSETEQAGLTNERQEEAEAEIDRTFQRQNDAPRVDRVSEILDKRFDSVLPETDSGSTASLKKAKLFTLEGSSEAALALGRTPNIEINTLGSRKLTVGQPSVYEIVVRNIGSETARKLAVTTKLPDYATDIRFNPSVGEAEFVSNTEEGGRASVWKVGTLKPGEEQKLTLSMTPTKRASFGLESSFDFERATASAEVEVQEPILEALIEGRDSIEWGVEERYRLRLRNVGNGDAENVTLEASTGENEASQQIGLLRAGEEKVVEMSVKTVSEDELNIEVRATGAYGLETTAAKRVATLRGKLNVVTEAPDLQFVDGEFDAIVRVKNIGNAALQNVDVVAQIPPGVEVLSCSNQARRNDEKRRVYWVAPFIRPNEEVVFRVLCRVESAGIAKFEAVAVDQTGLVAQARSIVNVESIAVLAMHVNAPKNPVAVGKTCSYELVVENKGTRDARDVNTGIFLGSGMKPLSVDDNQGYVYEEESKALFKKIDCLKAGESVVFRVRAEALSPGNQKIQAMLQSNAEDVSLLSEETTYCYSRGSRADSDHRREAMTAERSDGASTLR